MAQPEKLAGAVGIVTKLAAREIGVTTRDMLDFLWPEGFKNATEEDTKYSLVRSFFKRLAAQGSIRKTGEVRPYKAGGRPLHVFRLGASRAHHRVPSPRKNRSRRR